MTIPSLKPPFRFPLLSVSMRAVFIEVALGCRDCRSFVLDAGIQCKSIWQSQVHTALHLRLESLQLIHACLQYSCVVKVFDADGRLERVNTAWIKQLQPVPCR